jgi:hypothetical protein
MVAGIDIDVSRYAENHLTTKTYKKCHFKFQSQNEPARGEF